MATVFEWSGKTPQGTIESGEMTAANKDEVINNLRRKNITATSVTEKGKKPFFSFSFDKKVTDKDIVIFTRQFSTMIDAGLPLVQALDILSNQVENPTLGKVLGIVKSDVEGGSTFADALKKHPKHYTELYSNMVAAGESGGILDTILNRLAGYIEKSMKLKKKIKGAMVYPLTISTIAIVVVGVIMVFVVPVFDELFSSLGGTLPLPTRIIMGISNFLQSIGGIFLLVAIVGSFIGFKQLRKTRAGKKFTDRISLKLPIFGVLLSKVAIAKFTRTMGTLTSSGVPILDGLEITAKTSGNIIVEEEIMMVRAAVSEGKTLAEPLMKSKVFPPMVTHMIAVGETTGALDTMMTKIADFYDDEVDDTVNNLTAMMEPLLMVFLGTTVGFIIVAMYLPIFKMMTLIE